MASCFNQSDWSIGKVRDWSIGPWLVNRDVMEDSDWSIGKISDWSIGKVRDWSTGTNALADWRAQCCWKWQSQCCQMAIVVIVSRIFTKNMSFYLFIHWWVLLKCLKTKYTVISNCDQTALCRLRRFETDKELKERRCVERSSHDKTNFFTNQQRLLILFSVYW